MSAQQSRRNRTTVLLLGVVIVGMVGLSFASVPLYRLFCAATGFGGTTQRAETASDHVAAGLVTVRFTTEVAPDLDWEFRPMTAEVTLHPGEQKQVFFRAVNRTKRAVTSRAVYNVTPTKAGIYFDKLQCFCFDEQVLKPRETKDMGVVFFVDPDLLTDPGTRDVRTITLSYTMFRTHGGEPPAAAATARSAARSVN
ncbi:MAG TPA: cytochrome c oxidase assembly protein [Stellaceae bacterium]|nr:cytochrome c oxidase assembly protein [Stellaceae bacterium]